MYHQIKALRRHYSLRECADLLGISVNTVSKYDQMSLEEAFLKGSAAASLMKPAPLL